MYEPSKLKELIGTREVSPAPYTLESLIAWLERKNPEGSYDYLDPHGCMIYQYFSFAGVHCLGVSSEHWQDGKGAYNPIPKYFYCISSGHRRDDDLWRVWTFGAALLRARAYQAEQAKS
jgi:hypothetical protein